MVVALALVLSAFQFVVIPVHADSGRGDCRAANGGVHGTALVDYAQTYGGIRRGPDECGSLAPPL